VRKAALSPELADIEAVGVPPATFRKANFALAVALPPRSKSCVLLFSAIISLIDWKGLSVLPTGQDADPVTIPLSVVTQAADPTVAPAFPLIKSPLLAAVLKLNTPEPFPAVKLIFPVVAPPSVKVFARRLWIVDVEASNDKPLPLVVADIVATGAPAAIPLTANSALDVEVEPKARSNVEFEGDRRLLFNCQ